MKDEKDKSRAVKIGVFFGVLALLFLSGLVVLGSVEIAKINENVRNIALQNKALASKLEDISKKAVSKEDVQLLKPRDGIDGKDGKNGQDGKDSVSTHTITNRETIIEKELPPKDGEDGLDGKQIVLGRTDDGILLWKYQNDRNWLYIPIIDLSIGIPESKK